VTCLGEALIDFVAVEADRPLARAQTFMRAAGGAPANVAVALVRLGVTAAFLGKISGDVFGQSLRETLAAEGVDVRGLVEHSASRTPLAFVGSNGSGGRSFVFYHNGTADSLLRVGEVEARQDLIAHARVFHFGSLTLRAEPGCSATLAAVNLARESGCLVSFDPNVRLEVWDSAQRGRQLMLEAMQHVDVLKVSGDELEFLTGTCDVAHACHWLRARGPTLVVVTLGEKGCYYDVSGSSGFVPGVSVRAVDALGAGDAFLAGLLAGLATVPSSTILHDDSALRAALRFANVVGAITTTRYGAIPALPTRSDVQRLLDKSARD
jgi:fructokinase